MASLLNKLASIAFLVFSLFSLSSSFISEMQIREGYGENLAGNIYTFRHSVPDTTQFNITDFKQGCAKGSWKAYKEKYYVGTVYGWDVTSLSCSTAAMPFGSFRFLASGNTSQDGVSLYTDLNVEGREIYINRWPFGGVTMPVKSIAWSGSTNFTFYEGTNFDGKYACVRPGSWYYGAEHEDNIQERYNLTTVGSVLKGCVDYLTDREINLMRAEWEQNKY